ncbi:MAG: lipase family protein [Lachnospiraceae bacterium]|nr:lipase family protein [Lachnospiraceae bacterium]
MNQTAIIKSLHLSSCAYRDIQPYTSYPCTKIIDDPASGVQCYLRRDKDTLLITFRGTDSLREWFSNLTFWKKTIPYDNITSDIRVHTGFINTYKMKTVRGKILEAITGDTHYIKITGHSRGAALAVLCAVDIQYNYPDRDIEAVLFGCPRVGNEAFVKSYNKRVDKTVRVENGNDLITKIPFPFMGYRHVGATVRIGAKRLPFYYSANDHYPHKYLSGLLNGQISKKT